MPIQAEAVPRKLADPFDFGGGHMNPDKAANPGLREYTKFFNYTLGPKDDCESYAGQLYQLNLPSIGVLNLKGSVTVLRTVTNVGPADATYHVVVEAPAGVDMSVEPSVLWFNGGSKTATFRVTIKAKQWVQGGYTFGSLTWLDGDSHSVRIPVALYIVYMGEKQHDDPSVVTASHHDVLASVFGSQDEARNSIIYSYKHGFSGFAAMLTESQAKTIAGFPGVVSVNPNTHHETHTTRSWDFLGLDYYQSSPDGLLKKAKYGEDVIVGGQSFYFNATLNTSHFYPLTDALSCDAQTLQSINVTDMVVLCSALPNASSTPPPQDFSDAVSRVATAGGKGLIFAQNTRNSLDATNICRGVMPCVLVDFEIAQRIKIYYGNSVDSPVVRMSRTVSVTGNGVLSPRVAAFSSRGPSTEFPGIIKVTFKLL
ncbi:hypothetical protein EJB05_24370, partial [Eragrostis curvula]